MSAPESVPAAGASSTGTSSTEASSTEASSTGRPAVLVTGGAGYIGSHVCLALDDAGFLPVSYDNLSRGFRRLVRFGPLEEGDTGDRDRLDAVIARWRPVAAVHMAAFAYVGESVQQPGPYWRNNVANSITLAQALCAPAAGGPPIPLVFSSTCAVYGLGGGVIDESHPTAPINPYGHTKLAAERMLADFEAAHGLRSVRLRYFNAAGADPQIRVGECHDPEPHVVPLLLNAAAGRLAAFTVNGQDYDTPDGTCIRDYVHVLDLADAHVAAVRRLRGGGGSLTVNLGTGRGASIQALVAAAQAVTGVRIPVRIGERRPGDPPRLVAAAGLAARELAWTPRRSRLSTLLADAWRWHQAETARATAAGQDGCSDPWRADPETPTPTGHIASLDRQGDGDVQRPGDR